jgi:hypothetical protein
MDSERKKRLALWKAMEEAFRIIEKEEREEFDADTEAGMGYLKEDMAKMTEIQRAWAEFLLPIALAGRRFAVRERAKRWCERRRWFKSAFLAPLRRTSRRPSK